MIKGAHSVLLSHIFLIRYVFTTYLRGYRAFYLHNAYHRSKTAKRRICSGDDKRNVKAKCVLHPPYATTALMLSNGRKLLTWWPKRKEMLGQEGISPTQGQKIPLLYSRPFSSKYYIQSSSIQVTLDTA